LRSNIKFPISLYLKLISAMQIISTDFPNPDYIWAMILDEPYDIRTFLKVIFTILLSFWNSTFLDYIQEPSKTEFYDNQSNFVKFKF